MEGFDPPACGSWARRASSAPHQHISVAHLFIYKAQNLMQ